MNENYQKSIEHFTKAIEMRPDYPYAYRYRGQVYRKVGEYEKALEDFDKGMRWSADYNCSPYHYEKGLTYLEMNELEKADKEFALAIRFDRWGDIREKINNLMVKGIKE